MNEQELKITNQIYFKDIKSLEGKLKIEVNLKFQKLRNLLK